MAHEQQRVDADLKGRKTWREATADMAPKPAQRITCNTKRIPDASVRKVHFFLDNGTGAEMYVSERRGA